MNPPSEDNSPRKTLPKRDIWLLPLLSVLTLVSLLLLCEATASHYFVSHEVDNCQYDDGTGGYRFRANCKGRVKTSEGPWVETQYNECGYRTKESCKSRPKDTVRIAVIGSSVADGFLVDYDHTFAQRAVTELRNRCKRPVELQNLSRLQCSMVCMFRRTDEALALKPDVLIVAMTPYDIEVTTDDEVKDRHEQITVKTKSAETKQNHILIRRVNMMLKNSRTAVAAEHYMLQDPSTYLRLFMLYGDKADFLREPLSSAWERRLQNADILLGEMAEKARAANVPMVLIEMPDEPQTSTLFLKTPLPNVNATLLNSRLHQIATQHGIQYIDSLPAFRQSPGANKLFYIVDGHLNGEGHAFVSRPLVDYLTSGPKPLITGCATASSHNHPEGL